MSDATVKRMVKRATQNATLILPNGNTASIPVVYLPDGTWGIGWSDAPEKKSYTDREIAEAQKKRMAGGAK